MPSTKWRPQSALPLFLPKVLASHVGSSWFSIAPLFGPFSAPYVTTSVLSDPNPIPWVESLHCFFMFFQAISIFPFLSQIPIFLFRFLIFFLFRSQFTQRATVQWASSVWLWMPPKQELVESTQGSPTASSPRLSSAPRVTEVFSKSNPATPTNNRPIWQGPIEGCSMYSYVSKIFAKGF